MAIQHFGSNGLFDSVETFVDSGILKYTITDTMVME
jgi:hypothetical protein